MKLFLVAGSVAAVGVFMVGATSGGVSPQTVSVTLSEFKITSAKLRPAVFGRSGPLKPGRTTFTVRNAGTLPHNFVVISTSRGAPKFRTPMINPGSSARVTVDLKPGAYLAVCTVFNGLHYASGMVRGFAVGKQNQNGAWGP